MRVSFLFQKIPFVFSQVWMCVCVWEAYWSRSMPRYENFLKVLFFLISAAASASCCGSKLLAIASSWLGGVGRQIHRSLRELAGLQRYKDMDRREVDTHVFVGHDCGS